MIWNIFKKDLKLLWPLIAIVAAVHIINSAIWLSLGSFQEPQRLRGIATLFIIAVILGIVALIVTAVHQDAVPGDRQDWLVRPIRRRDLILAKLLFVLVAVQGPIFPVDLAHCMVTGFDFADSLFAALSRNIYMLLTISVPALALAAITATIIEVIGSLLAIVLTLTVFVIAISSLTYAGNGTIFASMSNGDLMIELWSAVALTAAAVVIPLQYFRRDTRLARGLVLGAVLIAVLVSAAIPWSFAFTFEQWLSPDPAAAKSVTVAFHPILGKNILKLGAASPSDSVWLPLRVSGLGPDTIVLNDRAYVTIIGRNGAILYRGLSTGENMTKEASGVIPSPLGIDDFPVRTATGGAVETHQFVNLPGKVFELVRNQPVHLEMDYSLTLFHVQASDAIAAVNGDKYVANFGLCKTKIDDDGDEVEIGCARIGNPITCGSLVLENSVSRQQNPPYNFCQKFYLPYNAHFAPDAMLGIRAELKFRDLQGLARYPVGEAQLANARILIKTYQPVAHFTRHLTIPEIRLGDWEAETRQVAASTPPSSQ